jgi:hypothetical protein
VADIVERKLNMVRNIKRLFTVITVTFATLANAHSSTASPVDFLNNGSSFYWCPTNNGMEWIRIEIKDMKVMSMKRYLAVGIDEDSETDVYNTSETQGATGSENTPEQSMDYSAAPSCHKLASCPDKCTSHGNFQDSDAPRGKRRCTETDNQIPGFTDYTNNHRIVASDDGGCYHTMNCPGARQIHSENMRTFESEEEAQEAGLVRCRRCLLLEQLLKNR